MNRKPAKKSPAKARRDRRSTRAHGSALLVTLDRAYSHRNNSSPDPADNQGNRDFLSGYAEGTVSTDTDASIKREWEDRGEPDGSDEPFCEWKRGMWAAIHRKAVAAARRDWLRSLDEPKPKLMGGAQQTLETPAQAHRARHR